MEISIDLGKEIKEALENYNQEVIDKANKVIDKAATEAYKQLKTNPNIPKRTGKYAKGFSKRKISGHSGVLNSYTLHNKEYRLTHLLEYGHKTPSGGKTRAFPHWEQAQEYVSTIPDMIAKEIEK